MLWPSWKFWDENKIILKMWLLFLRFWCYFLWFLWFLWFLLFDCDFYGDDDFLVIFVIYEKISAIFWIGCGYLGSILLALPLQWLSRWDSSHFLIILICSHTKIFAQWMERHWFAELISTSFWVDFQSVNFEQISDITHFQRHFFFFGCNPFGLSWVDLSMPSNILH